MKRLLRTVILCFALFLIIVSNPTLKHQVQAQDSGLRDRLLESISHIIHQYDGTCFSQVISLGDPQKFGQALASTTIRIDPAECARTNVQAKAVPPGWVSPAELIIKADPADIPEQQRYDFDTTVWHETIHLIEYVNGDTGGNADWGERHTYYYEAMMRDVLRYLVSLEQDANNPDADVEKLRAKWQAIQNNFDQGAGAVNPTYPVPEDLPTFEQWSGMKVHLSDVQALYSNGQCGSNLQSIFGQSNDDPLGSVWNEEESGFAGTWTRRGSSNVFDASWGDITAVLTITIDGNSVSVARRGSSDKNDCDYTGTLGDDGVSVSGTYNCSNGGPYAWHAVIQH